MQITGGARPITFLNANALPPPLSLRRGSRSRSSESNRIGARCVESSKRDRLLVGLYSFIMEIRSLDETLIMEHFFFLDK